MKTKSNIFTKSKKRRILIGSLLPISIFLPSSPTVVNSIINYNNHIHKTSADALYGPKYIGHRGCPEVQGVLENTIESWTIAGQHDYYWGIETDVYPTNWMLEPDCRSKLVCAHDLCCFRNYEGDRLWDKAITEMSYEECKSYPLIHSCGYPRTVDGLFAHGYDKEKCTYIPDFEDYLQICWKYKKTACIEIKCQYGWDDPNSSWNIESVDELMREIFKYSSQGMNYVLLDFDVSLLQFIRQRYGEYIPMQVLYDQNAGIYADFDWLIANNFSIDVGDQNDPTTLDWGINLTKDIVDKFHKKGLQVNTWIIDYEKEYEYLKQIGVDYITSDCEYDKLF